MADIMSRGQGHEVLEKLEAAGLDSGLAQVIINSRRNKIGKQIVEFLKSGSFVQNEVQSDLLEPITEVNVDGVDTFYASGSFTKNNTDGVKFYGFGSNFEANFLNKVEEPVEPDTLKVFRLKKDSLDAPIIAALGADHETKLAHLYDLLKKQKNGEKGTLLTNGYANIFYIRDVNGILWAVRALWLRGGWRVNADSVGASGLVAFGPPGVLSLILEHFGFRTLESLTL